MTTVEKDQAIALLERLDGEKRMAAVHFMEFLPLDPIARTAAIAPPNGEPVTEEDRRLFHQGQAWLANGGQGTSMEDVLAEFGMEPEDFPLER